MAAEKETRTNGAIVIRSAESRPRSIADIEAGACPRCGAPSGKRCVKMTRFGGWAGPEDGQFGPLIRAHRERRRRDG